MYNIILLFSVENKGYLSLDFTKYAHWLTTLVVPMFILLIGGIPLPGGAVYIQQDQVFLSLFLSLFLTLSVF